MNKVILTGFVGQDPEIKYSPNGDAIANLSLATIKKYKKEGQTESKTTWHKIEAWKDKAELIGKYVKKGDQLYIEGKIIYKEFTDKEGKNNKQTIIRLSIIEFLNRNKNKES